jgi:PIN domain nuclease of toxin-antitoxin system
MWGAIDPDRLSSVAAALLKDERNQLFFSALSIWEVAIKSALNKKDFNTDARVLRRGLLDAGYLELPITSEHAVAVYSLPPIHKDPFDRLLIAQAMVEGITLLTADRQVARYPGPIRKV